MNALAIVDDVAPSPLPKSFDYAVAVRLADEGIPIRAIARATHIPSEEIYEALRDAIAQGSIIEMPRDDWPPGSGRGNRSVFNGTPLEHEHELKCACARFFKASPLEAAMIAVMLRRNQVTKEQLHAVIEANRPSANHRDTTEPKMVDVMICKMRKKLLVHNLKIETMWGLGYLIPAADRERAIALLMSAQVVPTNV